MPTLAVTETSALAEHERLRQRFGCTRREVLREVLVGEVFAHDDELVAAQAGDGVLPTDGRGEPLADFDEELVAGVVPEAVVHDLEAVEVDEQDREHRVTVAEAGERVMQAIDHQGAVRQPRQVVVQCHETESMGLRGAVDGEGDEVARAFDDGALGRGRAAIVVEVHVEQRDQPFVVGAHDPDRPDGEQTVLACELSHQGRRGGRDVVDHDGADAPRGSPTERRRSGGGGRRRASTRPARWVRPSCGRCSCPLRST